MVIKGLVTKEHPETLCEIGSIAVRLKVGGYDVIWGALSLWQELQVFAMTELAFGFLGGISRS